jgi:hypothetical protein
LQIFAALMSYSQKWDSEVRSDLIELTEHRHLQIIVRLTELGSKGTAVENEVCASFVRPAQTAIDVFGTLKTKIFAFVVDAVAPAQ